MLDICLNFTNLVKIYKVHKLSEQAIYLQSFWSVQNVRFPGQSYLDLHYPKPKSIRKHWTRLDLFPFSYILIYFWLINLIVRFIEYSNYESMTVNLLQHISISNIHNQLLNLNVHTGCSYQSLTSLQLSWLRLKEYML